LTVAGKLMLISVGATAFCSLLNLRCRNAASSGNFCFSRSVYSGNCPTQNRIGLDKPVGVATLISRSPGSALVATLTRKVTLSASAGFWFLRGAKRNIFCRISAAIFSSAAVQTTFVPDAPPPVPPRRLRLRVAATRFFCNSRSLSRRLLNSFWVKGRVYSPTWAWTPAPETKAPFGLFRYCPPTAICTVVP
jgi:hypothetical protein